MRFKKYLENSLDFDDLFGPGTGLDRPKKKNIISTKRKSEPYSIELYHGTDKLYKKGDDYVLDPKYSEQGLLWFTHIYINNYDPIQYAKDHGKYMVTYPLKCIKHYDEVTYEDGSKGMKAPKDIKPDSFKNDKFRCFYFEHCLELPEGWFWTYKHEKFIGTNKSLTIKKNMIS